MVTRLDNENVFWYTKRVGRFVVLVFEYTIRTPLTSFPVKRETIIGKIRG
jgi:hypothetical protein